MFFWQEEGYGGGYTPPRNRKPDTLWNDLGDDDDGDYQGCLSIFGFLLGVAVFVVAVVVAIAIAISIAIAIAIGAVLFWAGKRYLVPALIRFVEWLLVENDEGKRERLVGFLIISLPALFLSALHFFHARAAFHWGFFGLAASFVLIGEAFAFLRRKTDRTEPEEIRGQLDQLYYELRSIQRTSVYADGADEEAEAEYRREPPEGSETG